MAETKDTYTVWVHFKEDENTKKSKKGRITISATSDIEDLRKAIPLPNPGMVWDLLLSLTPGGPFLEEELPLSSVFGPGNNEPRHIYVELPKAESETEAKFDRLLKLLETPSNSGRSSGGSTYGGIYRDPAKQGAMRAAVMARDKKCVVTGNTDLAQLECAHIVGLNQIHGVSGLPESQYYDPSVGIALEKNLHSSFDNDEWYFEPDGKIVICNVKRREPLKLPPHLINLPSGLEPKVLKFKAELAERRKKLSCELCWKPIGDANFAAHYARSCCENPDRMPPTTLVECEYGQKVAYANMPQHLTQLATKQLQLKKQKIAVDEDDNKTA